MRLYLSSYKIGNHPNKFLELLGSNKKIALIRNAIDHAKPGARKESVERAFDELRNIGLSSIEELDLRDYFGKEKELEQKLVEFGGIWIAGGNVFVLNRAFRKSGFGQIIRKLLAQDKLVYAGYSAGTVLATPTLRGIELVDDVGVVNSDEILWDGLGLVNYSIAPHYRSDHPESEAIEKVVDYFKKHDMPYKTLKDGEVLIVKGKTVLSL